MDAQGRRARLRDLVVDLAGGDYPPVTRLIVQQPGEQPAALLWSAVQAADWRAGSLRVADLTAAQPVPPAALTRLVLLKRDLLDALVLDLQNRSALRSNDLWLQQENDRLVLCAADASPWAVVRRLSRGLLGHERHHELHDWKDIEFLRGDPAAARAGADYHRRLARLPPATIAHLLDALPYLHAAEALTLLPDALAADVLEVMMPERQLQVFEELEEEQGKRLLALMASNAVADLVSHLPPDVAQRVLERLPGERRERVVDLLRYPEGTAGEIMTNEVVSVPAGLTVGEACRALRQRLMEPDFIYFIYVVDDEVTRRLRGVLTLRDLLVADADVRLERIMYPYLVTIHVLEPAIDAAQRVTDSYLVALPVVGNEGQLLGAVTVDAAVARLAPQAWTIQAPRVFS